MNKQKFSEATLLLIIFGLFNLFASGHWTVAVAAWIAPIFTPTNMPGSEAGRSMLVMRWNVER